MVATLCITKYKGELRKPVVGAPSFTPIVDGVGGVVEVVDVVVASDVVRICCDV